MKQLSIWIIAFWMAMTAGAATVQAQSVNMSRYITLTVQSGQPIKLKFWAAAAGTPVRVVSGSNSTDVTVGTDWTAEQNFTADGTTMTVYGDITGFECNGNGANLTALDVSHNTGLKVLRCYNNEFTSLDVSACTQLEELDCSTNNLTELDVSACTRLEYLTCIYNNFSIAALNRLYCSLPDRTGLTPEGKIVPANDATDAGHADVLASSGSIATGKNWKVVYIDDFDIPTTGTETCGSSALTVSPAALSFVAAGETKPFNVTGSVNWTATSSEAWLTLSAGSGTGNGSVNATAAANTGATRTATITVEEVGGSLTKTIAVTQAGNVNLSRYITLSVQHGQPIELKFQAAAAGTSVRVVSGSNTTDVTVNATGGYWSPDQNFTADGTTMTVYGDIIGFDCKENIDNLTALDASHNTELEELHCNHNELTVLNLSGCTQLEHLVCFNNRLTALDVSSCTGLLYLECNNNELTALDVSGCTQLKGLWCHRNHLFALDISGCTRLKILDCSGNRLTALDVRACTQLQELYCINNQLPALDVSGCTQLEKLDCAGSRLSALDVSGCTRLKILDCAVNRLTALDVSACTQLQELNCGSNGLTALDVGACTQLEELYCFSNNFSTAALNRLYCSLPDHTSTTAGGGIFPAYTDTDPGHANVLASSGSIATGKNWGVLYSSDLSNIPTTGTRACGPDFAVTPETVDITFAGETKPLTVTASEAWTARCDAPWITLSALSGTGNGTITVTAPAYADEWPRTAKIFFVSGALKDTVTVTQHPKPGPKFLALDYTELTLPVGASQRLVVTAYPKDADINRGVKWYSLNDDIATVSANGTVTALKPGRTEITVVANVGGQQTTCRVRVVPAEQMVTVTSGSDNTLRIALMAPSDADFTLSFDVDLPEGFALDAKKTAPAPSLADGYTVTVTGNRVEMKPGGLRAGGTIKKRDLLTLACTAVPGTSNGSYKGALRNLSFTPTAGYALRNVTVPFTFTYTVANETVDGLRVYAHGGALHLTLPTAQTVHIYHVDGAMVKTLALPAGDHVQPLAPGMYLVRVGERVTKILIK